MCCNISGQLYFRRSYFFTHFQSDYFNTKFAQPISGKTTTFFVTIFSEQLLFSPFSEQFFSQQLFFQNSFLFKARVLQSSYFFRIRSSLWQLLFGTTVYSLFRIKISKKELLFLHSINFFRKATFSKKLIF